ncbi:prepilin-type N-terminal cleavage/methylation domain-containing protein [bacterium]|nr:prepilin-type N-terminal cleavage/methylation domain-containing protein [bacterium]
MRMLNRNFPSRPQGLTLLELMIMLAIVGVLIFIALPTLSQNEEEATISFAKQQLQYLHNLEQQYFAINNKYVPFSVLAEDEQVRSNFDLRFKSDVSIVEGIKFTGPLEEQKNFYVIFAELPDGTKYKVDQTGEIRPDDS